MIRTATRSDLETITLLVTDFLQHTSYDNHLASGIDEQHLKKLIYAVLKIGKVWLYMRDEVAVGLLIAVKEQNIWMPSKTSLRELVFYVKEEHRRGPAAGKLFLTFCREAENMLNSGEIDGYLTTRMGTTDNYNLESRGFRLVETLYLKD